ncbi:hypothetical protein BMF94_1663 [Rhodotorula taiwanensis]|uniref:AB hydrolase-1 domain-containing protein n=1 Tax=Rhodotorula taiwanensis TaxID=741276 RepID=A0A2S5BEU4_9BASI|nr:hypothetical protein BMF94_1663 [Rhodotorula taiwanensis]
MAMLGAVWRKANRWIAAGLVAYIAFLSSLVLEPVQRALIYLHPLRIPFGTDFSKPELVGFSPGKVLPFNLTTHDGAVLGAWQVLPSDVYAQAVESSRQGGGALQDGPLPQSVFDAALADASRPTVLYFHGNAATRAASNRIRTARHLTDLGANFIIIDYRGFADSTRSPPPSEEGLLTDARRAWDYAHVEKGVPASQIAIMGQSLGTGVSAGLASRLANEGITPKALILVAPFSSIASLLETYKLGNIIPLLSPLRVFPSVLDRLLQLLKTRFDTRGVIETIRCPILILHAHNDPVIPLAHSRTLTSHLLSPFLPSPDHETHAGERRKLVKEYKAGGWGVVSRFERGNGSGEVTWAEALKGAHNEIGTHEYSIELVREQIFA